MRRRLFLALLATAKALIGETGETGADERGDDEEPEVAEGRTASKDGL